MHIDSAIKTLSALAQKGRLSVFRLLVRSGADGLPAGEIARTLDVPHNTLSTQLTILANAGLVRSRRDGHSIIYTVEFETMRGLLTFLMEDCCQCNPQVCAPLLETLLPDCQ
jgi:DNA-binding transcriptional ArsR family regulator